MVLASTTSVIAATEAPAVSLSLDVFVVIALVALLVIQQLASASEGPRLTFFSRALNVGVVPMFVVFAAVVVTRVIEILR